MEKWRVLLCARTHHWFWGEGGFNFSFYSVQDSILDILNEILRPPLPPISMMEKWRVLLCARIHHWFWGEGGFNFSFYSVQDCVGRKLATGPHFFVLWKERDEASPRKRLWIWINHAEENIIMAEDIGKDDSQVNACNTFVENLEEVPINKEIDITGWDANRVIGLLKSIVNHKVYIEGSTFTLRSRGPVHRPRRGRLSVFNCQQSRHDTNLAMGR